MTPAQRITLQQLQQEGFHLVLEAREVVRVTRNGDNRVIMRDGSQRRGHHVDPAQAGHHSPRG
ncbi:hypothetical protein G7007_20760 [Pseudomonas entomophila]|uniref:hypothetical protein n=1 Tax=Pseudomonas entomophila TaxID=312306 RepID=UPI0015E4906B|nr:hypothetical protein [Pseudomonas entomophila]MBA1195258.1 hypothetical protein [Pseudomonas entomophila]